MTLIALKLNPINKIIFLSSLRRQIQKMFEGYSEFKISFFESIPGINSLISHHRAILKSP